MKLLATAMATIMGATVLGAGNPIFTNDTFSAEHKSDSSQPAEVVPAETLPPAVPPPKMISVQEGDYLEKLAKANDSTALRLFYANTEIINPDLIYPDQSLRIPLADEALATREVPANQQIVAPTVTESAAAAAPQPSGYSAPSGDGSVWDSLAACEAGGNWSINTGNGYYGGLQFTLSSWQGVGGSGYPNEASREEQIVRGQMLQSRQGWGAWPACSAKLGL